MDVQNLGMAAAGDAFALLALKKTMATQATQAAQLLQALPPAPQPAHLGRGVDFYA